MNSASWLMMGVFVFAAACGGTSSNDDTGRTTDDDPGDSDTGPTDPVDTTTTADTGTGQGTDTGTSDCGGVPCTGPCYDETAGDGTGCYGQALLGDCAPDYQACLEDTACVAMETCNAACSDLTGEAWQTCSEDCRTGNPDGVGLFDAYQQCIYCSACAQECAADAAGKGCGFVPEQCPLKSTECYGEQPNGQPQCWGCAMANDCKAEVDACTANSACGALEACLAPCNEAGGANWQTCTDACKVANVDGVADLEAYHYCVYCTAGCKSLCPGDGPACP